MNQVAHPTPKDIPGLWDLRGPDGSFYSDLTTMQVMDLAHKKGWLLPEPSPAERGQLMRDAGHDPSDFC